jgi:hypothetical protein
METVFIQLHLDGPRADLFTALVRGPRAANTVCCDWPEVLRYLPTIGRVVVHPSGYADAAMRRAFDRAAGRGPRAGYRIPNTRKGTK